MKHHYEFFLKSQILNLRNHKNYIAVGIFPLGVSSWKNLPDPQLHLLLTLVREKLNNLYLIIKMGTWTASQPKLFPLDSAGSQEWELVLELTRRQNFAQKEENKIGYTIMRCDGIGLPGLDSLQLRNGISVIVHSLVVTVKLIILCSQFSISVNYWFFFGIDWIIRNPGQYIIFVWKKSDVFFVLVVPRCDQTTDLSLDFASHGRRKTSNFVSTRC